MYERAVELDPGYARAYSVQGWSHLQDLFMGWTDDPAASLGLAFEAAQKGLALDSNDNRSHWVVGAVQLYMRQHDRAQAAYDRALELNPNDADVLAQYAAFLLYVGRFPDARAAIDRALRLNPHCPWWYHWLKGWCAYWTDEYEDALAAIERIGSPIPECRMVTIISLMALGREDEARAAMAELLRAAPHFNRTNTTLTQPFKDPAHLARLLEPLEAAGLPTD